MNQEHAVAGKQEAWRAALLAVQAAAALWLALWVLPAKAAWLDGGVLFAAYVLLSGWLMLACGAWARTSLRGIGWAFLVLGPLSLALFYQGAVASSSQVVSFGAIPYFTLACLIWAALAAEEKAWPAPRLPEWASDSLVLTAGLAVGLLVYGVRVWCRANLIWPEDKTSVLMLMQPRVDGGASDIFGEAFKQWFALLPVAGLVVALGALVYWRRSLQTKKLLLSLFGLTLLMKAAVAGLSSQGYGIIPRKIISLNTNFFTLSKLVDEKGIYGFLSTFNASQPNMGFHADTHPPLAMLVYWLLRHLTFGSATLTAIAVMAFSALAIWPLYRLGQALGDDDLGLGMVLLYITSPMCLILGNAGADSMALTLTAYAAWRLVLGAKERSWRQAGLAGVFLAGAGMLSFASNASLVFLGTLGLLLVWRRERSWTGLLAGSTQLWGAFLAGALAVHLLMWALSGFHFNYEEAVRTARFVHSQANQYRPYELWSWANAVLYAGYAGAGLMGLWLLQQGRMVGGLDTRDLAAPLSLAFVLTMVFAAFGRAEVQRQFLFGLVFLLPSASAALPRGEDGRLRDSSLGWALLLNLGNAVLLQAYILDYW